MSQLVTEHYERYPYPSFPLVASVRTCDTYALNLTALWTFFRYTLPPESAKRILIAGCGSFSPYPFAVANPDVEITALDLSQRSLKRARLHCLLHRCRNIRYVCGDLRDPEIAGGLYGYIDAYGVLHHLDDPLAGLRALGARLLPGGIMRVMVYSRYARREEESIRRALRLMKIRDTATVKKLIQRSQRDSRLRNYSESSSEACFEAGLADALLHPCVHTFRIDELIELIRKSGLTLLRFAHADALADVESEITRLRKLESEQQSPGNFLFYLSTETISSPDESDVMIAINPCLKRCITPLRYGTLKLPPRFGLENPGLGHRERSLLRSFVHPRRLSALPSATQALLKTYIDTLFLLRYRH